VVSVQRCAGVSKMQEAGVQSAEKIKSMCRGERSVSADPKGETVYAGERRRRREWEGPASIFMLSS